MVSPYLAYYYDHVHLTGLEENWWEDPKWKISDGLIAGVYNRFISYHVDNETLVPFKDEGYKVDYQVLDKLPVEDQEIFMKWVEKVQSELNSKEKHPGVKDFIFLKSVTPNIMRLTTKIIVKHAYNNGQVVKEQKIVTIQGDKKYLERKKLWGVVLLAIAGTAGFETGAAIVAAESLNLIVPAIGVFAGYTGFSNIITAVRNKPVEVSESTGRLTLSDETISDMLGNAADELESKEVSDSEKP